jgi:hypothetical protein
VSDSKEEADSRASDGLLMHEHLSLTPRFIEVSSNDPPTVSTVFRSQTVETVKGICAVATHPAEAGC